VGYGKGPTLSLLGLGFGIYYLPFIFFFHWFVKPPPFLWGHKFSLWRFFQFGAFPRSHFFPLRGYFLPFFSFFELPLWESLFSPLISWGGPPLQGVFSPILFMVFCVSPRFIFWAPVVKSRRVFKWGPYVLGGPLLMGVSSLGGVNI